MISAATIDGITENGTLQQWRQCTMAAPMNRNAIILKSTESTTFTPLRNPQIMTFIYLVYWCAAQCPTALGRQDLVSTHLFIYRFALLGQFRAGALVIANSLIDRLNL